MSQYYFKPSVSKDRMQVAFFPTVDTYAWMMELKNTVLGMTPSVITEAAVAYARATEKDFLIYSIENLLDAYILRQKKSGKPVTARLPTDAMEFAKTLKSKFPARIPIRVICSLAVGYAHSNKEDFMERSITRVEEILMRK